MISAEQLKKLTQFITFCVRIYVPWWISCALPAAAPHNDLKFINDLLEYKNVDKCCAEEGLKAFSIHMWYLSPEMIPLGLFNDNTQADEKEKIARSLPEVSFLLHLYSFKRIL